MWSDSGPWNAAIVAFVSIITLILRWLFSRHDTAYENMQRDNRLARAQLDWFRAVTNLMDQEIWGVRRAAEQAGIVLEPRKAWPPFPEPDDS